MLFNGTTSQPERKELRLSEAFGSEADIEVKVTMLNINYGMNAELMKACKPLEEYSWLVDTVRRYQKIMKDIEQAVDVAISEMPDDFLIKKFLLLNKAEVKGMFLTEYDQEKVLHQERRDVEYRVATDMLKDGKPLDEIKRYTRLAEDAIRNLANRLEVTIV